MRRLDSDLANSMIIRPTTAAIKAMFDIATLRSLPKETMRIMPAKNRAIASGKPPVMLEYMTLAIQKNRQGFSQQRATKRQIRTTHTHGLISRSTLRACSVLIIRLLFSACFALFPYLLAFRPFLVSMIFRGRYYQHLFIV